MHRCPPAEKWIMKMWLNYIVEYYSSIMKKEIIKFSDKLVELEITILSEVTQIQKYEYHMFSLMYRC